MSKKATVGWVILATLLIVVGYMASAMFWKESSKQPPQERIYYQDHVISKFFPKELQNIHVLSENVRDISADGLEASEALKVLTPMLVEAAISLCQVAGVAIGLCSVAYITKSLGVDWRVRGLLIVAVGNIAYNMIMDYRKAKLPSSRNERRRTKRDVATLGRL
jgi:hypothetical protein